MGQRFQSVFILPPIFMNEGNPNNRERKVLVFHNQWLFGYTALELNLKIMSRIKRAIALKKKAGSDTAKDFINHQLENSVLKAVDFCSLQDIHNERKFSKSSEFEFKDFEDLGGELTRQDNNNGFFICEIDQNLKLKYSFISGFEDEDQVKPKNPQEYLNIFYSLEDQEKLNKENKGFVTKTIKGFLRFDGLLLFDVCKIAKSLNENLPIWAKKDGLKQLLSQ